MTVFERMMFDLQLLHMNLRGQHAQVTPPCEDLPTLVHTRDKGTSRRTISASASKRMSEVATRNRQEGKVPNTAWLFESKRF